MFSLLVVYIGISVGDQIIKRMVAVVSLTGCSPQQHLLVPVLSQDLDFQRPMSWSSLYSMI